uniref:OCRE domain-containing protein n=1 Tax=Chenopodium quinoa TaxID=63459 RepID=A0A803N8C3_CHEQI
MKWDSVIRIVCPGVLLICAKKKAAKEKQEKEDARTLQQIDAKATRSYQKDIASQESKQSQAPVDFLARDTAWEYSSATGYYYDQHTGIQYDPKSGFYYSDDLGNWVTQEEAFAAAKKSAGSKQKVPLKKPLAVSTSVGKRKRPEKPKAVFAEEAAALRAREAARKRVEDREKNMLGLYGH